MKKLLQKFIRPKGKKIEKTTERSEIEKKVYRGVEKALDEYKEVFKKLAEYDRS